MSEIQFQWKRLHPNAKAPQKAHFWDAGYDLFAVEDSVLYYEETTLVKTGVAVSIPNGYFGLLSIRSSLGSKGYQLSNAPGIVDSGYRGEVILPMTVQTQNLNLTKIKAGSKVAQMVLIRIHPDDSLSPIEVDSLPESDGRGIGGFGSTGG